MDDIVFPSKRGMQTYLEGEAEFWAPFFEFVSENLPNGIHANNNTTWTADNITSSLSDQIVNLGDQDQFNRNANSPARRPPLPPPSDSLEAHLIMGLFDAGYAEDALACFVFTLMREKGLNRPTDNRVAALQQKGKLLVETAPIVKALPFSRVSNAKMAGAARMAENHLQALADQIEGIQGLQEQHSDDLDAHLEAQKAKSRRIHDVILRLNKRRDRRQKLWLEGTKQLVAEAFEDAEKKVRLFELRSKRAEDEREKQFEHLQNLFATQLRLRAPVKLWEGRETSHSMNSAKAMQRFVSIGALAIMFGLAVPFLAGDYIAASFHETLCLVPATEGVAATSTAPAIPALPASECDRVFSAKGPITVTGLLLVTSLLLWFARLQYRVHLSERHLALDASEKKAFAETYLAMKEGKDVGADNEAIILGSLFRPTQDGIIKDDGSGMDISAAAILAKQLGKPN
ncbi:DUF6161 domain-containing protein [Cognatiyoonia sp. IB215182]|uniref:DUF6161 domain-containing protein n=1 Tax=Cognatiyoonia sp. IB215182 TaxID=3097353 RepID=UPI002A2498DD|nr:DUF6161 domain-containing protein [Cognatiyoonia sp. IB215182]